MLLLVVLVVSLGATVAYADPGTPPNPPLLTMTANVARGNHLEIKVGISHVPHGINSVQFQVQGLFASNRTITPFSQFYSGSAVANIKGNKASMNFIAPYPGPGDYFVQVLAINPQNNLPLANVQGDPFSNVSFIANPSSDHQTLILQLSIGGLKKNIKSVNFVVTASFAAPSATDYTPFYSGGGTAQVCGAGPRNCGVQNGNQPKGGTAALTLNLAYQGDGSYFMEVYVYNAKDGSLLGSVAGDPREGTGG